MPATKKQKASTSAQLRAFLDSLDTLLDETNTRQLVTAFVKLPSRKLYPDYYKLIEEPVSLHEILKRVAKEAYEDVDQFVADFTLMAENAVKYNDPNSWIVEDAQALQRYVEENAALLANGDFEPAPADDSVDLAAMCLDLIDDVINHAFPEDGVLSGPFLDDIDPVEYPEYFQVIKNPTSFNNVKRQIESSLFSSDESLASNLLAFHESTLLIFQNAQEFNDPSSLIHEDLKKLQAYFEEKFHELEETLAAQAGSKPGFKLTIRPPKEPVKLKLSLKGKPSPAEATPVPEGPPKKRRGRKPKKLIEEEQRLAALEAKLKKENSEMDVDEDEDPAGDELAPREYCAMGKSSVTPTSEEVFIRHVNFSSSPSGTSKLAKSIAQQPQLQLSKAQISKSALFPETIAAHSLSFFNYHFLPLGYSSKAYSITLNQDTSSSVNFKVSLHELIYNIKRDDLVDGQGILKGKAEEDFMCTLLLNDEEVTGGCEMSEEVDPADGRTKMLELSYDVKLNYGLNVLNFELRLSASLSKRLKKLKREPELMEIAGRHTRHQLQQIKLNWDVEKFTLFVVSLGT